MGIYQQISGSLSPISQGGVSRELLERISTLEQKVSEIENTKSSEIKYGLTMLSNAGDVTETGNGIALAAVQNNAAIEGTLANKTGKNKEGLESLKYSDRISYPGKTTQEALVAFAARENFEDRTRRTSWLTADTGIVFVDAWYNHPNISGRAIFYEPAQAIIYFFLNNQTHFWLYKIPFDQVMLY